MANENYFSTQFCVVSSYGIESAVLLHITAQVNQDIPVLFIDTLQHFEETMRYRDTLNTRLGLTNIHSLKPSKQALDADPDGLLCREDPNLCCGKRKIQPLKAALANYGGWISGRKRYQGATRSNLPVFEMQGDKVKINPLASWKRERILGYFKSHNLPSHPLAEVGYSSIGCKPCTIPNENQKDSRLGRWHGTAKTECGIHERSTSQKK